MNIKDPNRLARAERLNYIVDRLRVSQDITPAALAEELHVSERTVYRDLRTLEKGQTLKKRYSRREGRYVLENELALSPVKLTPSEALAVYVAAANPSLASDGFYASDLRTGLEKIAQALAPSSASKGTSPLESRAAGAPISPTLDSIQRPILERIRRAIRTHRKLRIRYWSASADSEKIITVSPYDLRLVGHNWYLLANSEEHGGARTFKSNHIRAADITSTRFRYPRGFSSDAFFARIWEVSGASDEEITVQLRVSPRAAGLVAASRGRQFSMMEAQPNGSLLCTATVSSLKEIAWWILAHGGAIEVLSPQELRAAIGQAAQEMVALYAG